MACRDPADQRVDPIAVAYGRGQPLQHERADALAEQDAAAVALERRARLVAEHALRVERGDEQATLDPLAGHDDRELGRARAQAQDRLANATSDVASADSTTTLRPRSLNAIVTRPAIVLAISPGRS